MKRAKHRVQHMNHLTSLAKPLAGVTM